MSELFKWDRGAKLFLHNLLGADHGDTLAGNVAAGDLIHGNAAPKWARLAKGTQGQLLRMGASLPAWYSEDGWVDCSGETWAYGSASTILVTGDYSTKYKKGLFISWVQTTTKYGVLASDSSYNSGTDKTTLTIIVNTDHVVANAAISGQKISFAANPQGWPGWFNWLPTLTGYSANPTNAVYRFCVIGNLLSFIIREAGNGTSNAATLTISTPVTAKVYSGALWGGAAAYVDNGSASTSYGRWVIGSGESALTFGVNPTASGGFTTSGSKRISFCQGFYEI